MCIHLGKVHPKFILLASLFRGRKRRHADQLSAIEGLENRALLAGASPVINPSQVLGVLSNTEATHPVGTVVATDAEHDPLTYAILSGNEVGAFDINSTTGLIFVKNQSLLNALSTDTVLSIKVSETATPANSDTENVTIRLNRIPNLNAATFAIPSTISTGEVVGSVTGTDPDANQTLSYFIIEGNESGAYALNPSTGVLSIFNKAAFDNLAAQQTLKVEIRDSGSPQGTDPAFVTINVNHPPVVADQEFFILAPASVGSNVGIVAATDPNAGQSHTFQLTGPNHDAFAINSSGQITVANTTLLNQIGAQVTLGVQITDGGTPALSDTANITIHLNRAPTLNDAKFAVTNTVSAGFVIGTVNATDPDPNSSISYFITAGNSAGAFSIDQSTGTITVAKLTAVNALTGPAILTVEARDNGNPQGTAAAQITITVNQPPNVESNEFYILSTAGDNSPVGNLTSSDPDTAQTRTFELTGTGHEAFNISSSGQITVAHTSLLNGLGDTAVLTVKVTDSGTPALAAAATVTIHLNHPPILDDVAFQIPSTIAMGEEVGKLTAFDPDTNQTVSYSITDGNNTGAFAIDPATGVITVANLAAFVDLTFPKTLTVQAQDSGDPQKADAPRGMDLAQVTISLNRPPLQAENEFFILTDAAAGTKIGTIQSPNDGIGGAKTYRILPPNTGAFTIDANTGDLKVGNTSLLNSLGLTYDLTVEVMSTTTPAVTQVAVEIHLNRRPVVTDAAFTVHSDFGQGHSVGVLETAHDPDPGNTAEGTLTYFITAGNDTGAFAIDPQTGEITVANKAAFDALSFPVPLTVQVRDGGDPAKHAQGTANATVTIILEGPPVANGQLLFLLMPGTVTYQIGAEKPARLDPNAIFRLGAGVKDTFDQSTLTVTSTGLKGQAPGKLSVFPDGPGGHITVEGESVLYDGVVIATFDKKSARQGDLVLKFNEDAKSASIQELVRRIAIRAPGQATSRTVTMTFNNIPDLQTQLPPQHKTVNIIKRAKKTQKK